MRDLLTYPEIEQLYPSEWVLIDQPQTDELNRLVAGMVVFHSKDREEVYRQLLALKPKCFAVRYTGNLPPNTAIVI